MIRKLALIGAISALALGIAGCDDDDDAVAAAPAPVAMSGTAAVGAPLTDAEVTIVCTSTTSADADPITVSTHSTTGVYTVLVSQMTAANATTPCALRVENGSGYLYSVASALGVVNITTLTDLVVAKAFAAASATPADAFNPASAFSSDDIPTVVTALTAAQAALKTQLENSEAGAMVLPDLFTTSFEANGLSIYDRWLDNVKEAWGTTPYATVLSQYLAGTYVWPTIVFPVPTGTYNLFISGSYNIPVVGAVNVPEYQAASNVPVADVGTNLGQYYSGATGITVTPLTNTETEKSFRVNMNYSGFTYVLTYRYVKVSA